MKTFKWSIVNYFNIPTSLMNMMKNPVLERARIEIEKLKGRNNKEIANILKMVEKDLKFPTAVATFLTKNSTADDRNERSLIIATNSVFHVTFNKTGGHWKANFYPARDNCEDEEPYYICDMVAIESLQLVDDFFNASNLEKKKMIEN
jgi:hypothetical protein